jgi:hypothetical protein
MMAHGDKEKNVKVTEAPTNKSANTDDVFDASRAPVLDLAGIESKTQKVLSLLMDRVNVLEAKCANMPIARPVIVPQKENWNTDTVAGM